MGVTAPLQPVPSLTLGTMPVPPLQMAAAYATLAADGTHHRAHVVASVQGPDGKPLFENGTETNPAIPRDVAPQATQALTKVVNEGTGRAAALPDRQVAGKT